MNFSKASKTKRKNYILFLLIFIMLIVGISFIILFKTIHSRQTKSDGFSAETSQSTSISPEPSAAEPSNPILPSFFIESQEGLFINEQFNLNNYYITNRVKARNRFYIDENNALWGYGSNEYGQLGIGKSDNSDVYYDEPVLIAQDVISVDLSTNNYFCIYVTKDGNLYGMGSNLLGLLGKNYDENIHYNVEEYEKVTAPVLLMSDVSYARAGMFSIVALKKDKSVWWWGEYKSTSATKSRADVAELYWKSRQDEFNPKKMLYNAPVKILDNCIYATTGNWRGAAISTNGDLYTWGLNLFGECGTEVSDDDFIRKPQKVLENVKMVWPEQMIFNDSITEIPEIFWDPTSYQFNLFAELKDGTMVACGQDIGEKEKTLEEYGDLTEKFTSNYSDVFLPIELEIYNESN